MKLRRPLVMIGVRCGDAGRYVRRSVTSAGAAASWPPGLQQVSDESPALLARSGDEDVLPAARLSRRTRRQRADGRGSDPDRLGCQRPHVGHRDARLHAGSARRPTNGQPIGRISVLEDTNRDGKMDKRTVFLDGLVLPRALKVLDKGVLVGEPPHLWLARDTNGDLKADSKELVCDCYGTELGNVEHNQNGLLWAMDNWMYTSEGDTYFRFKDGKIETRKTLSRGQWGATQDDFGRVYRNSNSSALHVDLVPTPYYLRNPNLVRTRGSYEFMGDQDELNATFPVRPNRGVNRGYQTGQLRADGTLATYTGVNCADGLPRRPAAGGAGRQRVRRRAHRQSRQPHHRQRRRHEPARTTRPMPTPSSWRRPTSGSGRSICPPRPTARSTSSTCITASSSRRASSPSTSATTSSRTSSRRRSTWAASGASCTTRRGATDRRRSRSESPAQLVGRLSHPNGWWRDTAQQLLVQRGDKTRRPGAEEARRVGAGPADAAARAVDAGRTRQPRARDAGQSARRQVARRAGGRPCGWPSASWPSRTRRCTPRC